ncbi:hypothetical protein GGX14DRAFT_666107 [Mycena pura]|uniref:Arrestin-like N-terminal domain-containing protein n=1 Tax=Mycena pura TaxID=153505 RepID=A0AAD6V3B4_9AGAR|nr:hypothetical protein GGX14DRAFT_666107 [Mycena pura]
MATVSRDGPLALHFQNITRVAGETLQGRVDLNVQLAQEEHLEHLRIQFCGTIHTKITTSSSGEDNIPSDHRPVTTGWIRAYSDHNETVILFDTKRPLWDQGTMYPAPGSHILSCPFEFKLPDALPPSFHCEAHHRRATVGYSLEVLEPAPRQGVAAAELERKVDHISMPDLPSFPVATPIPFSFYVETDTKPMHDSDDAPVDKHGKPLFPAPPAMLSDVLFHLLRSVELRVRQHTRQVKESHELFGNLGDPAAVRRETNAPEWIPNPGHKDKKGRGFWRRSVKFESTVSIPYAPTFRTETVEWKYELEFVLPFPGVGNDMRILLPIRLDPGSACPPPPIAAAGSDSTTYTANGSPAGHKLDALYGPASYIHLAENALSNVILQDRVVLHDSSSVIAPTCRTKKHSAPPPQWRNAMYSGRWCATPETKKGGVELHPRIFLFKIV